MTALPVERTEATPLESALALVAADARRPRTPLSAVADTPVRSGATVDDGAAGPSPAVRTPDDAASGAGVPGPAGHGQAAPGAAGSAAAPGAPASEATTARATAQRAAASEAPTPAAGARAGGSLGGRPRVRLVAAPPPARAVRATGPALSAPPTAAERIRVLRALDVAAPDDELEPVGPARELPAQDAADLAARLALASVEVICGVRPAAQLCRWVAPGVYDAIRRRAELTRHAGLHRQGRTPVLRSTRTCPVEPGAVEAAAVVDDGRRVRAVAVRLEPHRGAWRATALEIG